MPRKGQAHAIDDEWRREVEARLAARAWKRADLARAIRASKSVISALLNGTVNQSPWVPPIEKALGMRARRTKTPVERKIDEAIAELRDDDERQRVLAAIVAVTAMLRSQ